MAARRTLLGFAVRTERLASSASRSEFAGVVSTTFSVQRWPPVRSERFFARCSASGPLCCAAVTLVVRHGEDELLGDGGPGGTAGRGVDAGDGAAA